MEDSCKSNIKRDPCIMCALKHLSQAWVIFKETKKGYDHFYWLVQGHMAEAEDELVSEHREQANKIRDQRIAYQMDNEYKVPFKDLVINLCRYNKTISAKYLKDLGYDEREIAEIQKA